MFTKFKIWFRSVVSSEVQKLETSLSNEREKLVSVISIHAKSTLNSLEAETLQLFRDFEQKLIAETSVVLSEKNKLIAELHEKIVGLEATTRKISHWKADDDTVASDTVAKVVK